MGSICGGGSNTSNNSSSGSNKTTIKSGDNLSTMAAQNNTTVQAIMDANPHIKNANQIYAGDSINIPTNTKKDNESVYSGIKDTSIFSDNNNTSNNNQGTGVKSNQVTYNAFGDVVDDPTKSDSYMFAQSNIANAYADPINKSLVASGMYDWSPDGSGNLVWTGSDFGFAQNNRSAGDVISGDPNDKDRFQLGNEIGSTSNMDESDKDNMWGNQYSLTDDSTVTYSGSNALTTANAFITAVDAAQNITSTPLDNTGISSSGAVTNTGGDVVAMNTGNVITTNTGDHISGFNLGNTGVKSITTADNYIENTGGTNTGGANTGGTNTGGTNTGGTNTGNAGIVTVVPGGEDIPFGSDTSKTSSSSSGTRVELDALGNPKRPNDKDGDGYDDDIGGWIGKFFDADGDGSMWTTTDEFGTVRNWLGQEMSGPNAGGFFGAFDLDGDGSMFTEGGDWKLATAGAGTAVVGKDTEGKTITVDDIVGGDENQVVETGKFDIYEMGEDGLLYYYDSEGNSSLFTGVNNNVTYKDGVVVETENKEGENKEGENKEGENKEGENKEGENNDDNVVDLEKAGTVEQVDGVWYYYDADGVRQIANGTYNGVTYEGGVVKEEGGTGNDGTGNNDGTGKVEEATQWTRTEDGSNRLLKDGELYTGYYENNYYEDGKVVFGPDREFIDDNQVGWTGEGLVKCKDGWFWNGQENACRPVVDTDGDGSIGDEKIPLNENMNIGDSAYATTSGSSQMLVNPMTNTSYMGMFNTNLENYGRSGGEHVYYTGMTGYPRGARDGGLIPRVSSGQVIGPGGPRDDLVGPVALSNKEYVLPEAQVRMIGGGDYNTGIRLLDKQRNDALQNLTKTG